ncbi:MAG: glucosaminidase domain-containing protein [Bacteroidota bacterium]
MNSKFNIIKQYIKDNKAVWAYLSTNWYKIAILGFLLFVLFKKDIRFGVNFQAPEQEEQRIESQQTQPKSTVTEREYFTEHTPQEQKKKPKLIERFSNLPLFNNGDGLKRLEEAKINQYVQQFANIARAEHQRHGIPASILLASAVIHSEAGQTELAKNGNNQFQLTCSVDWKGAIQWKDGVCYRQYDNQETSFRDYSLFLTTGPRTTLTALPSNDYKAWAAAIEDIGYSSERKLARRLVAFIEKHQLQQLDVLIE